MYLRKFILILIVHVFLVIETIVPYTSFPVWAQTNNDRQEKKPPGEPEKKGIIDTSHEAISKGLLITANWIDSFFSNEQYEREENRLTLRLYSSVFQEEGKDAKFDIKARLRIVLPKTEDKLHFILSGKADDKLDMTSDEEGVQPLRETNKDETYTSLWYFFKSSLTDNFSTRLGLRIRHGNAVLYAGPRYRHLRNFEKWSIRFTESVTWFSDTKWESITSLDFERPFFENFLFRTHLEGAWYEEKRGYFPNLTFSLYQSLGHKRALEYSWSNDFETRPNDRLTETALRVRGCTPHITY